MENGKITTNGTYQEIQNSHGEFSKLFKAHTEDEDDYSNDQGRCNHDLT